MEEWKNDVPAVLMAWCFGMEGGHALARVLFGEVNPSGKTPLTTPKDESPPPFFDEFANTIEYGPYHGYTLFDKEKREPAFPFGHGLSYTTYAYKNLSVATPKVAPDGRVAVSVDVTNTGKRAGEEIVQPILPRCRPAESTVHGRRRGGSLRLRDRFAWQQIVARTGDGADHNQDDPSTTKDGESGDQDGGE